MTLRQEGTTVTGTVTAENEPRAIEQAARILSLDHDGTGYAELEDPIVNALQERSDYLRPVLFHSPYEAAAWSVISARTQHAQAVKLRDALRPTASSRRRRAAPLRDQLALPGGKLDAPARDRRGGARRPARPRAAARRWTPTTPTRSSSSSRASARSTRA